MFDKLPMTANINGAEVAFNSDFRIFIEFEMLMQSQEPSEVIVEEVLRLCYPNLEEITDFQQAFNYIIWFYLCGHEEVAENGKKSRVQAYSFEKDAGYLFAAFLDQYRTDLYEIEYLHWWKFRAMFESLRDDVQMSKIMAYRVADTSKMDAETRKFYKKMKKQFSLASSISKAERAELDALDKALLGDGDLSKIL